MHRIILILLLLTIALGGCAATIWVLQPTINNSVHAWVQAETRTDPVDDLVRFRRAERDGRAGTILLPVFIILSLALLLLLLTTPLPRILKELRLLRKAGRQPRRQAAPPPGWLEQSQLTQGRVPHPPPALPTQGTAENQIPLLPPPQPGGWLENE
jgi:hypothetical protein